MNGVSLTSLGFGAASIGNLYRVVTDEDAAAAVEAAWERGVRYFDTAPHYGLGLSERRLGAVLRGCPRPWPRRRCRRRRRARGRAGTSP